MNRFDATQLPMDGPHLVEASAGTGKTHAITTLVTRLVVERAMPIERVLVVTFTEAATAELRGRIRARLRTALRVATGEATASDDPELFEVVRRHPEARQRLALALTNVDRASVFTIHGFCHRTLLDSAFDSGARFDVELLTDTQALRDEVLFDFWTQRLAGAEAEVVRSLRIAKRSPSRLAALVDEVTRAPRMPVLPAELAGAPSPDVGAYAAAFEEARRAWEPDVVERLIVESTALSGSKYRKAYVPRWCGEVSQILGGAPSEPVAIPDKLDRFTPDALREGVKKGYRGREPTHPFFDAWARLVSASRDYAAQARAHALGFEIELVDYARRELPERKDRLGVLGFDDLLIALEQALRGPNGQRLAAAVRARHPVALIDEFQDTDPIQWAIFRTIYGEGNVVLIGDPKQAIYAFRGADVFAYLAAAEGIDERSRFTMDVCWRSDPGLISALSALYERVESPFALPAIDYVPVSPRPEATDELEGAAPLEILFVARGSGSSISGDDDLRRRLPAAVAAEIARTLAGEVHIEGRTVREADVAVLTRTNRQAFEMQRALEAIGIHSVVLGDQSVFEDEQPEARELGLVLAAIVEPTNTTALRSALTTELLGVTANELAGMEREDARWDEWVERFRWLSELWHRRGFVQMFRALLRSTEMVERLLGLERGERRVTNLLHLMELLQTAASTQHLGPAALLSWLAASRRPEAARQRPEAAQIRLESDTHAVRITTVHRAKGLEYPIVFCPHLWDGTLLFSREKARVAFHDPDDGNIKKLDLNGADESIALAEQERFAENLRLLYVALTRAKHQTVVVWGALGQSYQTSPLGYLFHAPRDLGERPDLGRIKQHLKALGDDDMRSDLQRVESEQVRVRELSLDVAGVGAALEPEAPATLVPRRPSRSVGTTWRMASFSELTAGTSHALDRASGRDRDSAPLPIAPLGGAAEDPITLADFPRGPKAGDFFHDVLEHLDFTDASAVRPLVEERLVAHGFGVEHAPSVEQAMHEVLAAPLLPDDRAKLRLIDDAARMNELEFYFPVATPSDRTVPRGAQLSLTFAESMASAVSPLSPRELARPFAHHPSNALDAGYAERVAKLDFVPLEGFLKGYINLVFQRGKRFYVVDYKSNHLGDHRADYGAEALQVAMSQGHYYLQAHLYAVAVHRFLGRRLPGYRYDRHFGGILYLFIKGMHPDAPGSGVFFEKPPVRRIQDLSDLLEMPPARGGQP